MPGADPLKRADPIHSQLTGRESVHTPSNSSR
jgi:hypothetical protein